MKHIGRKDRVEDVASQVDINGKVNKVGDTMTGDLTFTSGRGPVFSDSENAYSGFTGSLGPYYKTSPTIGNWARPAGSVLNNTANVVAGAGFYGTNETASAWGIGFGPAWWPGVSDNTLTVTQTTLVFKGFNVVRADGTVWDISITGRASLMYVPDLRAARDTPRDYQGNTVSARFKDVAQVANPPVTASQTVNYAHVLTVAGWTTDSNNFGGGGGPTQLSFGPNGIAFRTGVDPDNWSSWAMLLIFKNRSNWVDSAASLAVCGSLAWRNNGNGHNILDMSSGVTPDGVAVSSSDAQQPWTPGRPMLAGYNGTQTFGVKVDRARVAETVDGTELILKSPNGTRWRITIDDSGTLQRASI